MNSFYKKLLALDLVFYKTHEQGYDPMVDIEEFWEKYDLKSFQDHIFYLFLSQDGIPDNKKPIYSADQLQEFLMDLLHLIRGYFEARNRGTDLSKINLKSVSKSNMNDREQKLNKEIFEFFERVSSNLKNKL
ncbi:hypothetical protein BWD42_06850 [Sphingobacterium sp. CZ-UAM]|uniref:hypothetical protein n=1 Tax=Sphingobacterium sp. CZ-UAM TaxID=1933868 RepID=UPI0009847FAE|nr:hypothetical protein [Sphingobacterium sp. CZ-UAM]OOG19624.1 hypothetical protein BWD42_06850 [Sphingobacterium sp. CZ-UAM]